MIVTEDIYDAINSRAPWAVIAYMMDRLEFRGIYVGRSAIRHLWAETNEIETTKKFVPVVGPGENVIAPTVRQVMRDSEEG